VATLKKAMGLAPGDAEIENSVADVTIQKFDSEVAALRDSGRDQDAKAKEIERDQFLFDDLQDRVARYPNDLVLRYRLGGILFENDYINEAIQQFQLAQRNPQHRAKSLYYLGLCFRQKKQYDMAIEQLEAAAADLVKMDGAKKDVLYALGEISEETDDRQKAAHYFKQIYQVDIRYRDIAEKIEKAYAK
jgi:tetratricopeptide (TPR) repeat protein